MSRLECRQLTKTYGQHVTAVNRIDWEISPGERMVVVGPSGCGKSTLLRLLAGLIEPDAGQIFIDQREATHWPPPDRQIELVLQSENLFPHLSVADNLAFALQMQRAQPSLIEQRVAEAVRLLQLESLMGRRPHELSGGERQRVALGRVFVGQKPIWLLDEPLSNLDATSRSTLRQSIRELHRQSQATLIHVTHDQHEALSLATRMAVMYQGRFLQVGHPEEIYHRPNSLKVAELVGDPKINLWQTTRDEKTLVWGQLRVPAPASLAQRPATLGIRPECLTRDREGDFALTGTVIDVEFLGHAQQVELTIESDSLRFLTPHHVKYELGQTVTVQGQWQDLLVFDLESGQLVC